MDKGKIKKNVVKWGMLLLLIVAAKFGAETTARNSIEKPDNKKFIAGINATLPKMLDENIRINGVSAENEVIVFNHTLVNASSSEIDQIAAQKINEPFLVNKVCVNAKMTPALRAGTKYRYDFFGNDSVLIFSVLIDKQKCHL